LSINMIPNREDSAGMTIQVTELHSERSKGVGSMRVGLESDGSLVPSRITRRFEPANGMAVHTFEFNASNTEALLESSKSRVFLQTRAAAQLGAWQLETGQPIRVEVTSVPESLPQAILPTTSFSR
jgi:hypothetical protein